MAGFDRTYWDLNYAEPNTMDCIGNASKHIKYIQSFFDLEEIDISSLIDLGAGYGHLFQKALKAFMPYRSCAIEPSKYAFEKLSRRKLPLVETSKCLVLNEDIEKWCQRKQEKKQRYDLGLCTSVLQYLDEETLKTTLPVMARRIKYLYLTVPTDLELDRQITDLDFNDTYALRRSRDFYRSILAPHFTNISSKIWESKYYYDEESTLFTDLVYRS